MANLNKLQINSYDITEKIIINGDYAKLEWKLNWVLGLRTWMLAKILIFKSNSPYFQQILRVVKSQWGMVVKSLVRIQKESFSNIFRCQQVFPSFIIFISYITMLFFLKSIFKLNRCFYWNTGTVYVFCKNLYSLILF